MLPDNIRKYRKRYNLSQDELAEKLNISRQSISLWENGATQPTVDNILALAAIFGVSPNDLLADEGENAAAKAAVPPKEPKKLRVLSVFVALDTVILFLILLAFIFFLYKEKQNIPGQREEIPEESLTEAQTTAEESTEESLTEADTAAAFDLFAYCRDFAIRIGQVNGDFTIYQQPAKVYGGSANEYFSISYWGDSDMVEFSLHCPFSETLSENFYLRMRGGYDGLYEYASSYYYRSSGESICSAEGYIDPAVFSESYPLPCSHYSGDTSLQNKFMEESRQYLCILIKCLKRFTKLERMDCGFEAFGFTHF